MSYTLYVVHYPVFILARSILERRDPGFSGSGFGWLFVGIAGILAFSYLAHLVFERPFSNRARPMC